MYGVNRAADPNKLNDINKAFRTILESVAEKDVPCIFISYQRADEEYAESIAKYILSKKIDVYFDLNDSDLKQHRQNNDPLKVTAAIRKGLNESNYMLVIVSPKTLNSPWVSFEIGYAFDKKGQNLKVLRHKGVIKASLPQYLKVKEILNGTKSLNTFLDTVMSSHELFESKIEKSERTRLFSNTANNPLSAYLDNE